MFNRISGRWLAIGLLVAVGLYFLYRVRAVLSPFVLAIALTYLLNPVVSYLNKRQRLSRTLSIVLVYLAGAVALSLLVIYGFPALARELVAFTGSLPRYTQLAQSFLDGLFQRYERIPLPESVRQVLDENIRRGEALVLDTIRTGAQMLVTLVSQAFSFVVAPILAFYFLQDSGGFARRVRSYLPATYQEEVLSLLREIDSVLQNFVLGRLLVAFIVSVLTTIGLTVIGMDLALVLGLIAGISDLIPYFGPVLGALPALLLAGLESTRTVIYVLVLFVAVQQVESNILSPLILGESVGLHPVLVIFALLAGGHLYGVWGVLLAVPVAAVIRILLQFAYQHPQRSRGN